MLEVAPYAHVIEDSVREMRLRRMRLLDDALKRLDYKLFWIRNGDTLEPVMDELDPRGSTDVKDIDYLCVPSEFSMELH